MTLVKVPTIPYIIEVTNMQMQPIRNYWLSDTSPVFGSMSEETEVRTIPPKLHIMIAISKPASVSLRKKNPRSDAQKGPVLKMIYTKPMGILAIANTNPANPIVPVIDLKKRVRKVFLSRSSSPINSNPASFICVKEWVNETIDLTSIKSMALTPWRSIRILERTM